MDLQFAFLFSPPKWVGCQGSQLRPVSGAQCRSALLTCAFLSHTLRAILSWRPPVHAPSSRGLAVLSRVGARAPTSVAPSCRRPDGLYLARRSVLQSRRAAKLAGTNSPAPTRSSLCPCNFLNLGPGHVCVCVNVSELVHACRPGEVLAVDLFDSPKILLVLWCKPARLTTFLNWRHFGLH